MNVIPRKATVGDVKSIYDLIKHFSEKGLLLLRTMSNIYDNLRDFKIIEIDNKIVAIAAMHVCWEDLGEIRSICVDEDYFFKGYGTLLVNECIKDAKELKLKKIFVLTYQVKFFEKLGFYVLNKKNLPHKVWAECVNCPKFPNCDETAMMKELY